MKLPPNGFGGGKFLFMNAAKVDIAGVVIEVKLVVKPGEHTIIKPKPAAGKDVVSVSFYFRKEDAPRAFFSSRWPIGDHPRALVLFCHDPESLRIRMHTIRDLMQPLHLLLMPPPNRNDKALQVIHLQGLERGGGSRI